MKKILFLSLFLMACTTEVSEEVEEVRVEDNRSSADGLDGTWNRNDTLDDGGFSWFVEYRFEGDEYWKSGYPPIEGHGNFEIIGDTLSFTPKEGAAFIQAFSLAENGQTLDIGGQTFTFVK